MTTGIHANRTRLLSLAMIGIFDIAGPLVAYSMLRSAGQSQVSALILSGALPALGIIAGVIRHRRVDTIGVLVLAGIVAGTVLGLLSGSPPGWSWPRARCPPRCSGCCSSAPSGRGGR